MKANIEENLTIWINRNYVKNRNKNYINRDSEYVIMEKREIPYIANITLPNLTLSSSDPIIMSYVK